MRTRLQKFLRILNPAAFSNYVAHFNSMEDENVTNFISNADSWNWLQKEIPFFECPDREVEEMYYFRWWSFRKHLEQTTNGFVFTEFLTRQTPDQQRARPSNRRRPLAARSKLS